MSIEQVVVSTVIRCRGATATCEDVSSVYVVKWLTSVVIPVNLTSPINSQLPVGLYISINYHNLLLTYVVTPVNLTCPINSQLPVYISINYRNLLLIYVVIPVNLTCPINRQLPVYININYHNSLLT